MKKINLLLFGIIILALIIMSFLFINKGNSDSIKISKEDKEALDSIIKNNLGLELESYSIVSFEREAGRGGFIKSKISADGEPLELYYRFGWCSSGGTDCGWKMYFTSSSEKTEDLYQTVKSNFCSNIEKKYYPDPSNITCAQEGYDETKDIQDKCYTGEYEETLNGKKILTINQIMNRCWSDVRKGEYP